MKGRSKKACIGNLLLKLRRFYKKNARIHLPWRTVRDPYRILVSELMLQQTQVDRVVPFYTRFIKKFPTPHALARAPLLAVLKEWNGLGYNRRAKFLHAAARRIVAHGWPETLGELPGVGPYTSRAVAAFAYNQPEVFVETNIRTVFIYHCFSEHHNKKYYDVMIYHNKIADTHILPLVEEALRRSGMQPRDFYAALMDYGSYLKQNGVRLNAHSAYYTKQSRFQGSRRQLRGAIVRELLHKPATLPQLVLRLRSGQAKDLSQSAGKVTTELRRLMAEKMIEAQGRAFVIASANSS